MVATKVLPTLREFGIGFVPYYPLGEIAPIGSTAGDRYTQERMNWPDAN